MPESIGKPIKLVIGKREESKSKPRGPGRPQKTRKIEEPSKPVSLKLKLTVARPLIKPEEDDINNSVEEFNSECPVCGRIIAGDASDINEHVEACLDDGGSSSEEASAYSGDEQAPLVEDTISTPVNVEGDDSRYGRPQYTFEDVHRIIEEASLRSKVEPEGTMPRPSSPTELLMERIRVQQEQLDKHPKCLICLDSYQKPLVSVVCWHVSCEECWCRVLAAKRLCPQCKRITSPDDLRRIYL